MLEMATHLVFAPNEINPEVRRLPLELYGNLPIDPAWTKDETVRLVEQVNNQGPRWPIIATALAKSPEQCLARYAALIKVIPSDSANAAAVALRSSAGSADMKIKAEPTGAPSPTIPAAGAPGTAAAPTTTTAPSPGGPLVVKKRNRRPANQIQRLYKCDVPGCSKSYGTEGSLRTHAMLKHNHANLSGVANRGRRNSLPTPGQVPAYNSSRRKSIHDVLLQQQAVQGAGRPGSSPLMHSTDSLVHASASFGSPPASPFSTSSYPDSPESYLSDSSQQSDVDALQAPGARRHSVPPSASASSPPPPATAGVPLPMSGSGGAPPEDPSQSRRFSMPPAMPPQSPIAPPPPGAANPMAVPPSFGPLGTHSIGISPSPQTFVPIDLKSLKFANNHLIVNNSPHQLKYSQLPIVMLSIGSWHRTTSGKCGDLLARFSFYESKFTWEMEHNQSSYEPVMNRIDVPFDDVVGLGVESLDDGTAIFTVETNRPPQFFVAVQESHGAMMWSPTKDFTGGEASNFRRHIVHFFSGALNAPLEFLLGTNPRMAQMAKTGLMPDSPLLFPAVTSPSHLASDSYFRSQEAVAAMNHSPKLSLAAVQRGGMFGGMPHFPGVDHPMPPNDFSINSLVSGHGLPDQPDDATSWLTTEIPKISMEDSKSHLEHRRSKVCGHTVETPCDCEWNFLEPLSDLHSGHVHMSMPTMSEDDFISSVLQ
eukprot:TRINITY_DN3080_c0_g2_i1.p1 TRINITY_DN3080_c0_g2~~TRINITY_DN3080_c0_g2_i1.p1  ORF type:complete len:707 (+),score=234.27 TRINITY_DN3080_c0_g2_i1:209-2329(+)